MCVSWRNVEESAGKKVKVVRTCHENGLYGGE